MRNLSPQPTATSLLTLFLLLLARTAAAQQQGMPEIAMNTGIRERDDFSLINPWAAPALSDITCLSNQPVEDKGWINLDSLNRMGDILDEYIINEALMVAIMDGNKAATSALLYHGASLEGVRKVVRESREVKRLPKEKEYLIHEDMMADIIDVHRHVFRLPWSSFKEPDLKQQYALFGAYLSRLPPEIKLFYEINLIFVSYPVLEQFYPYEIRPDMMGYLEISTDAKLHYNAGLYFIQHRKPRLALKYTRRAVELAPKSQRYKQKLEKLEKFVDFIKDETRTEKHLRPLSIREVVFKNYDIPVFDQEFYPPDMRLGAFYIFPVRQRPKFSEMQDALQHRRYEKVIKICNELLWEIPDDPYNNGARAHILFDRSHAESGRAEQSSINKKRSLQEAAKESLKLAIGLSGEPSFYLSLAKLYGNTEMALACYERGLAGLDNKYSTFELTDELANDYKYYFKGYINVKKELENYPLDSYLAKVFYFMTELTKKFTAKDKFEEAYQYLDWAKELKGEDVEQSFALWQQEESNPAYKGNYTATIEGVEDLIESKGGKKTRETWFNYILAGFAVVISLGLSIIGYKRGYAIGEKIKAKQKKGKDKNVGEVKSPAENLKEYIEAVLQDLNVSEVSIIEESVIFNYEPVGKFPLEKYQEVLKVEKNYSEVNVDPELLWNNIVEKIQSSGLQTEIQEKTIKIAVPEQEKTLMKGNEINHQIKKALIENDPVYRFLVGIEEIAKKFYKIREQMSEFLKKHVEINEKIEQMEYKSDAWDNIEQAIPCYQEIQQSNRKYCIEQGDENQVNAMLVQTKESPELLRNEVEILGELQRSIRNKNQIFLKKFEALRLDISNEERYVVKAWKIKTAEKKPVSKHNKHPHDKQKKGGPKRTASRKGTNLEDKNEIPDNNGATEQLNSEIVVLPDTREGGEEHIKSIVNEGVKNNMVTENSEKPKRDIILSGEQRALLSVIETKARLLMLANKIYKNGSADIHQGGEIRKMVIDIVVFYEGLIQLSRSLSGQTTDTRKYATPRALSIHAWQIFVYASPNDYEDINLLLTTAKNLGEKILQVMANKSLNISHITHLSGKMDKDFLNKMSRQASQKISVHLWAERLMVEQNFIENCVKILQQLKYGEEYTKYSEYLVSCMVCIGESYTQLHANYSYILIDLVKVVGYREGFIQEIVKNPLSAVKYRVALLKKSQQEFNRECTQPKTLPLLNFLNKLANANIDFALKVIKEIKPTHIFRLCKEIRDGKVHRLTQEEGGDFIAPTQVDIRLLLPIANNMLEAIPQLAEGIKMAQEQMEQRIVTAWLAISIGFHNTGVGISRMLLSLLIHHMSIMGCGLSQNEYQTVKQNIIKKKDEWLGTFFHPSKNQAVKQPLQKQFRAWVNSEEITENPTESSELVPK